MIILLLFSIYSLLWINAVHGFSACDEVDITFIIDSDSIISHRNSIIQFIQSIAKSGSSEWSAYSVFVYGDIPNDIRDIELMTLKETQLMATRTQSEQMIQYRLQNPFGFISYGGPPRNTRRVDVLTAFETALRQTRPYHKLVRKKKLGYRPSDKSIGNHDGRHIYIVFDYNNRLLRDPQHDDMCDLFDRLDRHKMYHRDQKIHFLLGEKFKKRDTKRIWCDRRRPTYLKYNSFHHFSPRFVSSIPAMERIYDITCPAIIRSTTYDGYINVGNHVQYIDVENIIQCSLFYWDHDNDVATPDQLDTTKSFIKIKDYRNDDNTYQLYDYLVADPVTYKKIQKIGCRNPVYKIIRIGHGAERTEHERDEVEAIEYRILTLYVRLPGTPMEYISTANIKGTVPIHTKKRHFGHHRRHRRHHKRRHRSFFHRKKHESREWRDFDDEGRKHPPPPPEENTQRRLRAGIAEGDDDHSVTVYSDDERRRSHQLLDRIKTLKNIAKRAVNVRKAAVRLVNKYRHKRGINNGIFGAHVMEEEFLGKVGKFVSKIGHKVKKAVHHVVKKVGKVINKVGHRVKKWRKRKQHKRRRRSVIELNATKEWVYIFTPKTHRNVGSVEPKGFKLIMTKHDGALELKYGFWYTLHVGVNFKFYWKILYNKILIEYKIYGDWEINYHFNAKFVGDFELSIDNLLNDGHSKVFYIGSIPILLRAYTQIYAEIVTLPVQVYGGIRCQYKERIAVGYRYSNHGLQSPTKTRTLISKGCTKQFGISDTKDNMVYKCPMDEFRGFDLKLSVKVGGSFYLIMNSYLRMQFFIPFRINVPEMNPAVCELPPKSDMCVVAPYLQASFTMSMDLNVYTGSWVDVNKMMHYIQKALFTVPLSGEPTHLLQEKFVEGPLKIIPKRFMGCLPLNGRLQELNKELFPTCCPHLNGLYHGRLPPIKGQYVISANPMQAMLQMQGNPQPPFIPNPYYRPPPPNNVPPIPNNQANEGQTLNPDQMNRNIMNQNEMQRNAMNGNGMSEGFAPNQ